ncbi:PREDICTED: uncharacterized protein LOC104816194 [Tarenaya hassleriana]|uniref:uncharacterized protein LOC104816194 n=1 Tax=Tarenaya hassleriana TaxID=28532 RepID=UPI00053C8861|nr:PREDICTED: uncharacterized protein LOC104816194 [Tarenaya hassleriana]
MKSTKTRFAKKLRSIKAGDYLKQDRILQALSAADGLVELLPKISNPIPHLSIESIRKIPWKLEDRTIDVSNVHGEEEANGSFVGDKENVRPLVNQSRRVSVDRREVKADISSRSSDTGTCRTGSGYEFRRPDLDSSSLFDPKLLEAFERAVGYYRRLSERTRESRFEGEDDGITFPDISESEGRAEARRKCSGNDGKNLPVTTDDLIQTGFGEPGQRNDDRITLPATIRDGESQAGAGEKDDSTLSGEGRAEAEVKDDNNLRNSVRIDATEEEADIPFDDSALPEIISEVESRAGEEEEEEDGGGKDGNALAEPLLGFEARCPPGGENSVVLYTTTLRGIRNTFDDCNKVRFLLDSFRVSYYERDVSMHREYREDLRRIMAAETATELPVLFVKGECVGGAHRVLGLHEQGKLRALFDGVPAAGAGRCRRCDGVRFLMCDGCRGSRKIVGDDGKRVECSICNENGLIVCPSCS